MTTKHLLCVGAMLALAGSGDGSSRSIPTESAHTVTSGVATTRTTPSRSSQASDDATAPVPVYRLGATVACLKARRVAIGAIDPIDKRLRAMRDLAQRTSRQARAGRQTVGFVVGRTANDATLLVELLRVPKDPYRLERSGNAVLLYRPAAARLRSIVRSCLR